MAKYRVVLIPGDGVGPEIMAYAEKVLSLLDSINIIRLEAGLAYYEKTGRPYPQGFRKTVLSADAVLKGPLATPSRGGYRSITILLRRLLGVYADIRRFETDRTRIVIVREASEGVYLGIEARVSDVSIAFNVMSRRAARRISETGFELARRLGYRRVYAVHKATVLRLTDGLFLEEFYSVAKNYSDIEAGDMLVDSAAYRIIRSPGEPSFIVTLNQYGDILSDVAAAVAGSIGLFASTQLGEHGALFEPIHGTGFDIAGKNIANPVSALRATQYMLEYLAAKHHDSRLENAAQALNRAIKLVIDEKKIVTPDLGGNATTSEVGEAILSVFREELRRLS